MKSKTSETEEQAKPEVKQVSFLEFEGKLFEEILEKGRPMFLRWDQGKTSVHEGLEDFNDGIIYHPVEGDEIKTGAILLPTGIQEYISVPALLEEIRAHIHKYLAISEDYELFAANYILLSWLADRVNTLPYLRAIGDTGCGKSRFLDVIGRLCYKPCMVSGCITPAPIYRMIKRWGGTIVLDEADFRDSDEKSEVVTILNCGFEKGRPVIRCVADNVDKLQFLPTYGPKVISTRQSFKDAALESRCLTERMIQTTRIDIPTNLPPVFYEKEAELRNKLLKFRFDHYFKVDANDIQKIDLGPIEPRLKQASASFAVLFNNIPEAMVKFRAFLSGYNAELIEQRASSYDGQIVQALFKLCDVEGESPICLVTLGTVVTAKDIANALKADGMEKVTGSSVGLRLKNLGFRVDRRRVDVIEGEGQNEKTVSKVKRCIVFDPVLFEIVRKRYFVTSVTSVTNPNGEPPLVTKKEGLDAFIEEDIVQ